MKAKILEIRRRLPGQEDMSHGDIPPHSACVIVPTGEFDALIVGSNVTVCGKSFMVSHFESGPKGDALILCVGWGSKFPFDVVSVGDDVVLVPEPEDVPEEPRTGSGSDASPENSGLTHSTLAADVRSGPDDDGA